MEGEDAGSGAGEGGGVAEYERKREMYFCQLKVLSQLPV